MVSYSANGFSCVYPELFRQKFDFPAFEVEHKHNADDFMSVKLESKTANYEYLFGLYTTPAQKDILDLDMTSTDKIPFGKRKIFRYGEFNLFPGAKEMLSAASLRYVWVILIPVDGWLIKILISDGKLENIDKVFYPIVASMAFDSSQFSLDAGEYRTKIIEGKKIYRWANIAPDKSKSLKRELDIGFSALAFYDSALEYDSRIDFTQDSVAQRIFKQKEAATLLIVNQPELNLSVNLNKKAPKETDKNWDHIVEGIIAINSGKMFVSNYEAEIKISLTPGNYKFTVYFGNLDPRKNANERCGIYLWPTQEPETNDITVIKIYIESR